PIDPSTDVPNGFVAAQRGVAGGFIGDPDVMDTWATSSLTPQIAARWVDGDGLFDRVFPMDMRPQGHDIIRTWLFSTMVRSHLEHGTIPWKRATLSGWILDPDRKKMSKSKGNVVTPIDLFDKYGSDAVRYWAASARPGVDTAFSEDQMAVGRKLANKLLNVTKFVLGMNGNADDAITVPYDAAMLSRLADVVRDATAAFDDFDYARALERTEAFFWWFCDDYVELVKTRAYGNADGGVVMEIATTPEQASARTALTRALGTLQRLLAPHMPFCTDEVWSWWHDSSVHASTWPTNAECLANVTVEASSYDAALMLETVSAVLAEVRRAKTEAKVSQRAKVASAMVTCDSTRRSTLELARTDLVNAGNIISLDFSEGDGVAV
ncbi:MAG: valine--tRNA ligase, partial [Actinobacteria bacterium]|nr:valine--tRNA ligase [Actinomycetota bacterium]